MDTDSTEEAPLSPLRIHLSTSLPGSSIPIRAPLTIDSDSEYSLSINDQIHSRTSNFNSSCSLDISSVLEEDDGTFVAYPNEEIVIERSDVEEHPFARPFVEYPDGNYKKDSSNSDKSAVFRPFVKYPDGNYVKESSDFDEYSIFRPFVKIPSCEETGTDSGIKLGVPVAHLTSDCDSDVDSVDGCRWLDSSEIQADGSVQKVDMVPTVRVLDEELQFEGLRFGDDINDIDESNGVINSKSLVETIEEAGQKVECLNEEVGSVSDELVEDKERKVECLNEAVKLSESDELNFDSERIDAQLVSDSDNEIEIKTTNESEGEVVFDCCRNELKKMLNEKEEEMLVKMQPIRAKFLRLVHLLGLSNEDSIVTQLLHRLALRNQLTVDVDGEGGNDEFGFYLTILAIGKTGIGKSATINSIFGEKRASTDAFRPATATVREITGNVGGVQLRVFDTPGLRCCPSERSYNLRILSSIKRFTRKHTPDVVLYVDRLDTHTRDTSDSHLLRLITCSLGSLVWRNCIITLTHAASLEPSGGFVFQRCRFIQEQIVSLGCTDRHMANPVWLVENHQSYEQEKDWRTRLLLLCCSAKILHEASSMVERSLTSLERSRLFEFSDRLGHDIDIACSDEANEDECHRVPPFEQTIESQNAAKHSVECKKAYFKEYGYRVKLLGKKHWSVVCRFYS